MPVYPGALISGFHASHPDKAHKKAASRGGSCTPALTLIKDFHVVDILAERVGPLGRDCHHFSIGGDGSRPGNDDLAVLLLCKLRTEALTRFTESVSAFGFP